jgi:hydrogenase maturation protease
MAEADLRARPLVIGVGNAQRGDDAAGVLVLQRLRRLGAGAVADLVEHSGDGARLLETWQGREHVIVVDAVLGTFPGDVTWFDVSAARSGFETTAATSHAVGLAQAIEMARVLDLLPPKVEVCAIAAKDFVPFSQPSAAVERAAGRAAMAIAERLARAHRRQRADLARAAASASEEQSCTR